MPTQRVSVRLQYRPSGDILTGRTEFTHPDLTDAVEADVDQLDSDTSVTWAVPRRGSLAGTPMLQSFSILGAKKRFRSSAPDFLPDSVWRVASSLFSSVPSRSAPVELAMSTKAEAQLMVDVDDLVRPRLVDSSAESDIAGARGLAASLRALATALRQVGESIPGDDGPSTHPNLFVTQLEHLASVVAAHRRPAPSIVTLLRDHLRGGLPVTDSERRRIRVALGRTLDTDEWKSVATELTSIAEAVVGTPASSGDEDEQ